MMNSRKPKGLASVAVFVAAMLTLTGCSFGGAIVPEPDFSAQPEVIAVIGDFGSGRTRQAEVAKMVAVQNPSFVVTAGDNVYTKKGYDKLVGKYYPQKLVGTAGNHDYLEGIKNFDEFFGVNESARSYVYRAKSGVDFFILDSTPGLTSKKVRTAQRTWLTEQMASSKANFKVVVLHHPPYSSGKHGSTPVYQWPYAELGADLVISGHDHTYERIIRRGGIYIVDGVGGAKLYKCEKPVYGSQICDDKHYGALFLYVNSYSLHAVFRGTRGQNLDSFSIIK